MKAKLVTLAPAVAGLALLFVSITSFAQTAADVSAIKTTLETETRAFHEANNDLLRAQWSTKPYAELSLPPFMSQFELESKLPVDILPAS